ncbi:VWA domain-containing protein [Gimesia sp.]|uniref:VWA domain-containing protein n=1 Tax=Gimesia sp. TaxID=2024833 RepID=UPI000C4C7054|nr:VWA domain-containing protein [Gimesia sp.]MAX37780.1 transporter [Gimesia sp.]HBL44158.1 transporter [Planctomycetaceae bacterium]|tara:strand:- start:10339 stop:11262 length:924 start_codon:yes stop_codon:yes gene_type:complete
MMEFWTHFHFLRPGWLLLIPLAAGLWWLWYRNTEPLRGWREQVAPELLQALIVRNLNHRDQATFWLLAGWMIAIIASSGPTWKQEPNPFAADAAPLMVLLKADKSMNQPDPQPSALERARLKIADLVKIRKGQPIGLIAYAGSAHLVLPPTRDTSVVAEMASQISSEIMPEPGDRLDLAIEKADQILSGQNSGGTLLVIADSVIADSAALKNAQKKTAAYPIQFLSLRDDATVQQAAESLQATVVKLTPDDEDLEHISKTAERKSVISVSGKDQRWEEAGYWLVPLLAMMVAFSFRREERTSGRGET